MTYRVVGARSSVNPCDADFVEGVFAGCSGGHGTLGMDVAGTVVKTGGGDCRLKVGDRTYPSECAVPLSVCLCVCLSVCLCVSESLSLCLCVGWSRDLGRRWHHW